MRLAIKPAICETTTISLFSFSIVIIFLSLSELDFSDVALMNLPGTYIIFFIFPAIGVLFTWTLNIFKNILILINSFFVLHSFGALLLPIYVINPSAGETITSSVGIIRLGSLKN